MNFLEITEHERIATVRLNRPEKRNALSPALLTEIHDAFVSLGARQDISVIILEGNGKAFCAGADLEYLEHLSGFSIQENYQDSLHLKNAFHAVYTCPKPVIAKVSEVKIGFIPAIVMVYLLRKIGDTKARRLLLSAENISAQEAETLGLITKCVPDGELQNAVDQLAQTLQNNSASSMALTKDMLANLHGMSLEVGLNYAASMNAFTRMTDDCKNGIQSFLKK